MLVACVAVFHARTDRDVNVFPVSLFSVEFSCTFVAWLKVKPFDPSHLELWIDDDCSYRHQCLRNSGHRAYGHSAAQPHEHLEDIGKRGNHSQVLQATVLSVVVMVLSFLKKKKKTKQ